MPKSRRRKPKRSMQQSPRRMTPPQRGSGWGDFEPWARAMVAVNDAEAKGEPREALDIMEAFAAGPDGSYFWRPSRAAYLMQLALLRPVTPAWAISRWVCHQALQSLPADAHDRSRSDRALDLAIELRGGRERLPGRDEADAVARVMDSDWVYRQLLLYEYGGLGRFVEKVASSSLLASAGDVRRWVDARMGGYELLGSSPTTTTWTDLRTGQEHVTANIGSSVLVVPGESVIGRLVPSPTGELFEMRPMVVPTALARGVADDPTGWLDVLAVHRRDDPDWASDYYPGYDVTLLSDVPTFVWELMLLREVPPTDRDEDAWLARAVLDAASRHLTDGLPPGRDEAEVWPCVGAAILEPPVIRGLASAARADDIPLLDRLSETMADPAALACRSLALELSNAA